MRKLICYDGAGVNGRKNILHFFSTDFLENDRKKGFPKTAEQMINFFPAVFGKVKDLKNIFCGLFCVSWLSVPLYHFQGSAHYLN